MFTYSRQNILAGALFASLVGLVTVVATQSLSTRASVTEGLVDLTITPSETVTAGLGETIRFTAEGNLGTRTMPIRADWSILEGQNFGSIDKCANTKTCNFTASDAPGSVVLQARTGDGKFSATVGITVEDRLTNPFKDELPEWALRPIVRMFRKQIVKGYDDGRYGPADAVTRGQIVTLLYRILTHTKLIDEQKSCGETYGDVPSGHYASIPVCTFRQQGWSAAEDLFRPDEPATRGVTAGFLNRALSATLLDGINPANEEQIFDDVPVDHPHYADTAMTNATGLMTGYPTGDFGVDASLNRAEAAVVMYRVLGIIEERRITSLKANKPDTASSTRPFSSVPSSRASVQAASSAVSSSVTSSATSAISSVISSQAPASSSSSESPCVNAAGRNEPEGTECLDPFEGPGTCNNEGECRAGRSSSSAARLPTGACALESADGRVPHLDANAPDVGFGYARENFIHNIPESGLPTYCNEQGYDRLLAEYCAFGSNSEYPVWKKWTRYLLGGYVSRGYVSRDAVFCRPASSNETMLDHPVAACNVTRADISTTNFPGRDAPASGTNYARRYIFNASVNPAAPNRNDMLRHCTSTVFSDLDARYCANTANRSTIFQESIIYFFDRSNGNVRSFIANSGGLSCPGTGNEDADRDGYTLRAGADCNDANANVHPGVMEICNNIDDDCDFEIDEQATDALTSFADTDGDGYGNTTTTALLRCGDRPIGWVGNHDDCNDGDAAIHPHARDVCGDDIDNNCSGEVDEACS